MSVRFFSIDQLRRWVQEHAGERDPLLVADIAEAIAFRPDLPAWGQDCQLFLSTLPRPLRRVLEADDGDTDDESDLVAEEEERLGRYYSADQLREWVVAGD